MLLDIVFSLDSVLTAVGMVDEVPIMIAAVVIAVGVMLFASGPLSKFVHEHPTVKMLALSFLLLIGVTLIADGFGFHIAKEYIYVAMGFSVFVEALNLRARNRRRTPSSCARRSSRTRRSRPHPAGDDGRPTRARRASPAPGGTHRLGVHLGVGPGVAVVVGAAGRDEAQARRDLADGLDRRGVERAVVDLEAAQAGLDELAEQVDALRAPR